jgi:hypothetical protein
MLHALIRPPHHPTRLRRCGRVGVVLAVLALLLAQGLGLAHRVWHDPAHHAVAGAAQHGGHDDCEHGAAHEGGLEAGHDVAHRPGHDGLPAAAGSPAFVHINGLSPGHDEGSAECRLLDQLAHVDALLGSAPMASADAAPAAPEGVAPCSAAGRPRAAYQARAPPRRPAATPAAHTG